MRSIDAAVEDLGRSPGMGNAACMSVSCRLLDLRNSMDRRCDRSPSVEAVVLEMESVARRLPTTYLIGELFDFDIGCRPSPPSILAMVACGTVVVTSDHRAWPCHLHFFAPELESLVPAAIELGIANLTSDEAESALSDVDEFGELAFLRRGFDPVKLDVAAVDQIVSRAAKVLINAARQDLSKFHRRCDWTIQMEERPPLAKLKSYQEPARISNADIIKAKSRMEESFRVWFRPLRRSKSQFVFDLDRFRSARESHRNAASEWESINELGRISNELVAATNAGWSPGSEIEWSFSEEAKRYLAYCGWAPKELGNGDVRPR